MQRQPDRWIMRLLRRRIPGTFSGTFLVLFLIASAGVFPMATVAWLVDDGKERPEEYRIWPGGNYFLLVGAGRLTLVKQDVTRTPGGTWTTYTTRLGNVDVRANGRTVASVNSARQPRGWPPAVGPFYLPGPKVTFAEPGSYKSHVCTVNYSGVSLPLWAVALMAGAWPGAWLLWSHREGTRQARRRNGLCLDCGYDLRASPHRCPECGSVPQPAPGLTTS